MRTRALELLDLAVLKFLALCLSATGCIQVAALMVVLLSAPHVLYIPEAGR